MVNVDKEKINQNINEAYNNQTENVKKLLESAKKNLADQKACLYDYTTSKQKTDKLYTVSRVVSKKKQENSQLQDRMDENFQKMNEKLDINSKNLDFIFKTVSNNSENIQNEYEKALVKENKIIDEKIENIESNIEQKMNVLQQRNEECIMRIKQEIIQSYQKENKNAISCLMEEKNSYLRELEEKDRQIRELNYKIYEYEEKLEREKERRYKNGIISSLFRKEQEQEEEPTYTCQILNYVY